MSDSGKKASHAEELSRTFALIESAGTRLGLVVAVVGFLLYLTGWLAPFVPLHDMMNVIGQGVEAYVAQTGAPTGWGWLPLLGYSDMISLSALVIFVMSIVLAFVALVPVLIRQRDKIYLVLVLLQLAIFVLAGGNFLGNVGH